MQKRMIEFIRALRAAGLPVSLAESQDAMFAVDHSGVWNPATFNSTMKATLVKNHRDQPIFDYFFPLFFSNNKPPLQNILEQLSPEQEQLLQEALQSLMGDSDALRDLLQRLLEGRNFSDEELRAVGRVIRLGARRRNVYALLVRAAHEPSGGLDPARAHAGRIAGRTGSDGHE